MFKHIHKHAQIKMVVRALITMIILILGFNVMVEASVSLSDRFTPQESYYQYFGVKPAQESFYKKDVLRFNSFIKYEKDINMYWRDTIFCYQDGGTKKYRTQRWPKEVGSYEFKTGGTMVNIDNEELNQEFAYWEYTASVIDAEATACYLCYVAHGKTVGTGVGKVFSDCTDNFNVNL